MVAGVLSFAETGIRTTVAVRGQRSLTYTADGSVEAAINRVRNNGDCSSSTPTVEPTPTISPTAIQVTCQGTSTSGGGVDPNTAPARGVLTLGKNSGPGEDGIYQGSN